MDNHENQHHIVPLSIYYTIFLALMVGTALTWWVATIDLGIMNNVIMLAIAVTKASLVVLFFMHVKYSSKLTWVVVSGAIFFLIIMIVLTLNDYIFRGVASFG
ncbi:MAG: cytochrome C oxidase subunit IV family protein [Vicinamibacterales bacterium]